MLKDFVSIRNTSGHDETAFVAAYWTDVWAREGGVDKAVSDVTATEEYRLIAPIVDRLPQGALVLDGGCGLGAWTAQFRRRGLRAIGLDLSETVVQELARRFGDDAFRAGDIRAMEFDTGSVDFYFSWGVFEHFEDGLLPCIREAYRVLKPGGKLAISVPFQNFRHLINAQRFAPPPEPGVGLRFYQWRLTRNELARDLALGGFVVDSIHPIGTRQGLQRMFQRFGRLASPMARVMAPVVPATMVGHMLLAIAHKPE